MGFRAWGSGCKVRVGYFFLSATGLSLKTKAKSQPVGLTYPPLGFGVSHEAWGFLESAGFGM